MTISIETVAVTASTNADLLQRLSGGGTAQEGHWLRAERQSGGRGRLGRSWESPAGNLHCSTVVHLLAADPAPTGLALVAGLAVHDALSHAIGGAAGGDGGALRLKWPNDAMVGTAKIAGILLERSGDAVVVGIGINVAQAPRLADRETTSLKRLAGGGADAGELLERLAGCFAARLGAWRLHGLAATCAAWEERAHPRGTMLVVSGAGDSPLAGKFAGLDGDGRLLLEIPDGAVRVIHAGDVMLA